MFVYLTCQELSLFVLEDLSGKHPAIWYSCKSSLPRAIAIQPPIKLLLLKPYTLVSASWEVCFLRCSSNLCSHCATLVEINKSHLFYYFTGFRFGKSLKSLDVVVVVWVLWHINLCSLFNAKYIFKQMISSISNNSV